MLFIYNPRAGKEAIRTKLSAILEIFVKAEYEVCVYPTLQAKDATRIVTERGGEFDYIVCSGGDGTLNEVTDGIMTIDKEKRPRCGYIPTGTVNDFASSLKIPKNMMKAAQIVVEGEEFPCDIGSLNGDYFNYIAGFGAFTDVAYETSQTAKNMLGKMAYFLDGVSKVPNLQFQHLKITTEEMVLEDDYIFGMITNTVSVGGFKGLVGKKPKLDDGLFEVTLIKNPENPLELQAIVNALLTRDKKCEYIKSFRTSKIELESKTPFSWTVDGEYGGSYYRVEIENIKQAVRFTRAASRKRIENK